MFHISISHHPSQDDVIRIIEAAKSGPVKIHHSSCRTRLGRQAIAVSLKSMRCPPVIVDSLAWGTCAPEVETTVPVTVSNQSPTMRSKRPRRKPQMASSLDSQGSLSEDE